MIASSPQKTKYKDGTVRWHNAAGQLHRTDGPAVEWANGTVYWYLNGLRHRTDGPAVEYINGDCEWYLNGKRHRTDGPAVLYPNGDGEWWLNDKRHRTDGPAVEWANGTGAWWINGIEIELNPTVASFIENGLISLNDYVQCSAEKPLTNQ